MLRLLFNWLDIHPGAYWAGVAVPTLLLLGLVVADLWRKKPPQPSRANEWCFILLLLGSLLAWRWPYLLAANEYNPDESQFISGAITLMHDPVFWRSVDGTTSGPLNFYALLPLHLLGLPLDYFTARLTGLLLIWMAILICYRLFRSLAPPVAARLAVLPALIFFAAATDWDFIHYSSEHVSLLLTALSAYWLMRKPREGEEGRACLAGAFVAGLLPWAKLQTAPIGAVLVIWKLWEISSPTTDSPRGKWQRGMKLALFAALPSFFAVTAITITGQLPHFFQNYLLQNMVYVGEGMSLAETLRQLAVFAFGTAHFPVCLAGFLLILVTSATMYWRLRLRPSRLFILGACLTLMAAVSVLTPKRAFLHYLLLLIMPLTLWTGAAVGDLWPHLVTTRARLWFATILLVAGVAVSLGWRSAQPGPEVIGQLAQQWRQPYSSLGEILHAYTEPDNSLGIWGWLNSAYVESGLRQATRDPHSVWAILPTPKRDYYRTRYLADLQRSRPSLFIDAVGPGSQFFDNRSEQAHETFPALAEYVRQQYQLVIDLGYARLYAHPDLLARHPITPAELRRLITKGRQKPGVDEPPETISPPDAAKSKVGDRTVQMMLPPAELTWTLDGTAREVTFAYGFHPKAYTEGRSNGAELIAELRCAGYPTRQIFRRLLDPAHNRADRDPLSTHLVLPPYEPGTSLVLRTTPGEFGDTSWDWVYFSHLRFLHAPSYTARQFPAFDRVPDFAQAPLSSIVDAPGESLLILHAPSLLEYSLKGDERRLRFDFGFQPGAYTNGGQTDGAIYRVELHHADQPPRILFERHLQPLSSPADRGRQHAEMTLPDVRPGDHLVVRIDPGENNSWDWTYVADFNLR